jgi:hypothetical protein
MRQIRMREAIVLGLGIAIRPEFYLLVVFATFDWIYLIFKKQISAREIIGYCIPLLICGYVVFSIPLWERGSFLYHSSIVQGAGWRFPPDFYYIAKAFFILLENSWWIILLLLLNIFSFSFPKIKGSNAVIVFFIILLPVAQGFVAPQYRHFGRYVFPVLPLVVLSMMSLLRQNMKSGKRYAFFRLWNDRKKIIILSSIAVIASLPLALRWTTVYAESVRNINDQHLAVSSWIPKNIPENEKIAADEVGAIGYFTKRNVIDLTGLVSPEFYGLQNNQFFVWEKARKQGANIFIIYTRLNPAFYQFAKDSLELVKVFRIRPPLVSSADTVLSVFRAKGDLRAARGEKN